jgi:hypothetical protein
MRKKLQHVLLAAIAIASLQAKSQGWVAGSTNVVYPVNSSLQLSPLRVGIGTSNPSAQLHTTGTVRFAGIVNNNALSRFVVQDSSGNLSWRDASSLAANAWQLTGNTASAGDFLGTTNLQNLRFRTNNTERMVVTTDGNIGIGIANPNHVLSIISQGNSFGSIDRRYLINLKNTSTQFDAFTAMRFESSYTDQNPSGIGMLLLRGPTYTSIPGFANTFGLQTGIDEGLILVSATNDATVNPGFGKIRFFTGTAADFSPIERMRINNGGNIGINTTNPTAQLHTNGTLRFENLPSGSGTVLVADANGNVFRSSTTASRNSNDAEIATLKNQVHELQLLVNNLLANKEAIIVNGDRPAILQVSPNPAKNTAVIGYYLPSSFSTPVLHIYDANGAEVKNYRLTQGSGTGKFSLQTLPLSQGTYLVTITGKGQISNAYRLVIAR